MIAPLKAFINQYFQPRPPIQHSQDLCWIEFDICWQHIKLLRKLRWAKRIREALYAD
jgi:hypothetical protein